jgi:hypothetical protein
VVWIDSGWILSVSVQKCCRPPRSWNFLDSAASAEVTASNSWRVVALSVLARSWAAPPCVLCMFAWTVTLNVLRTRSPVAEHIFPTNSSPRNATHHSVSRVASQSASATAIIVHIHNLSPARPYEPTLCVAGFVDGLPCPLSFGLTQMILGPRCLQPPLASAVCFHFILPALPTSRH